MVVRRYAVRWHWVGEPEREFQSTAVTREGESAFEEIRKMLAVKKTGNPRDAEKVEIIGLFLAKITGV